MAFFLSFTAEGRQVFSVQQGKCSALMAGVPVITHNAALVSSFTKDPAVVVSVEQLPPTSIISKFAMKKMMVPDGDDALRGTEWGVSKRLSELNNFQEISVGWTRTRRPRSPCWLWS